MASPLIEIPTAVAAAIANASLSRPATVTRDYLQEMKLSDLGKSSVLDVRVYPGPMKGSILDRRRNQRLVTVKIAAKKLGGNGPYAVAAIDPWLQYMEEVAELLRSSLCNPLPTATPATWHSEEFSAPYLPDHLREFGQFTSVLEVTYVTTRG